MTQSKELPSLPQNHHDEVILIAYAGSERALESLVAYSYLLNFAEKCEWSITVPVPNDGGRFMKMLRKRFPQQ